MRTLRRKSIVVAVDGRRLQQACRTVDEWMMDGVCVFSCQTLVTALPIRYLLIHYSFIRLYWPCSGLAAFRRTRLSFEPMNAFLKRGLSVLLGSIFLSTTAFAADFLIRDGDRVVFLGDS